MKKSILKWLIPVVLLIMIGLNAMGNFNGLVNSDEGVSGQCANVEAQYTNDLTQAGGRRRRSRKNRKSY